MDLIKVYETTKSTASGQSDAPQPARHQVEGKNVVTRAQGNDTSRDPSEIIQGEVVPSGRDLQLEKVRQHFTINMLFFHNFLPAFTKPNVLNLVRKLSG